MAVHPGSSCRRIGLRALWPPLAHRGGGARAVELLGDGVRGRVGRAVHGRRTGAAHFADGFALSTRCRRLALRVLNQLPACCCSSARPVKHRHRTFVHHRRRLLVSLRERAEAGATLARRRSPAKSTTFSDIGCPASVNAGACRPDAPLKTSPALPVIRESATRRCRTSARWWVLRAPVGELPQPVFADLRSLVAEAEQSGCDSPGQEVAGRFRRVGPDRLPDR